jgi:ketosteroid isomerase-like protein
MGAAENKQVVQRAFDAWAAGEGGVFDLLAPDAQWTIVGNSVAAGTYHSREEFLASVIRPFNARLSTGLVPVVHALYADGDTVIAYFDASATVRDGSSYDQGFGKVLDCRAHGLGEHAADSRRNLALDG